MPASVLAKSPPLGGPQCVQFAYFCLCYTCVLLAKKGLRGARHFYIPPSLIPQQSLTDGHCGHRSEDQRTRLLPETTGLPGGWRKAGVLFAPPHGGLTAACPLVHGPLLTLSSSRTRTPTLTACPQDAAPVLRERPQRQPLPSCLCLGGAGGNLESSDPRPQPGREFTKGNRTSAAGSHGELTPR